MDLLLNKNKSMSLKKKLSRLQYIDSLISRKATGDTITLAKKLNLSRSQTLEHIKEMKEVGFPIKFCRCYNSYIYTKNGKLVHQLFHSDLSKEEMRTISGGVSALHLFPKSDYTGLCVGSFV